MKTIPDAQARGDGRIQDMSRASHFMRMRTESPGRRTRTARRAGRKMLGTQFEVADPSDWWLRGEQESGCSVLRQGMGIVIMQRIGHVPNKPYRLKPRRTRLQTKGDFNRSVPTQMKTTWIRLFSALTALYFGNAIAFCLLGGETTPYSALGFAALLFWLAVLIGPRHMTSGSMRRLAHIGTTSTWFIAPLQFLAVAVNMRPYQYKYVYVMALQDGHMVRVDTPTGWIAHVHMTATMYSTFPGFIFPIVLALVVRHLMKKEETEQDKD